MGFGTGNLGMGITFTLQNNATAPAVAAGRSINNLSKTVQTAGMKINNSANMITTGLIGVTLVVGALIGPFAAITSAAADFDSVMSELSAKANLEKNSIAMEEMRHQAIELGDATKFSAKEVGEGQTFLAMAGFNSNKILMSMPGLLNLAAAGNLGLARASDIASNTMAQFSLQASDMAHISDVIANAAVNSNQSVEQFAQGMKFLGPTASALSISLEEAASTMMLLANAGLQSSLGTRALGTSLASRLTGAIPKASDKMKELGLEVFDVRGQFVGMEEMIRRTQKATADLTQQQRMQSLSIIFGAESIQEITTLLKAEVEVMREGEKVILKGADAMAHFTKMNEEAAGTAEAMAKKMLDNLAGDMVKFKSVMETTAIVAGGSLSEALRPLVQLATDFLKIVKVFVGTPFGQWFIKVAAGVAALAAGMVILGFVVTVLTPAIWGMVTAVWALMVPLLPIIAGIALVAGAVIFLVKSFQMFTDVMAGAEAQTGFTGFMQRLGALMQAGVMIWQSWNGETFALTENMHDALQKLGLLDFVLTMGTYIVRVKEFFTGFIEGAKVAWSIVAPIWDSLTDSFLKLFSLFPDFDISIGKAESSLLSWSNAGKTMGLIINTFIVQPIALLGIALDGIVSTITFLIELFKDLFGLMGAGIDGGIGGVIGKISSDIAKGDAGPISNLIGNLASRSFGKNLSLAGESISDKAGSIGGFIADKVGGLYSNNSPTVIDKSVTTQGNVTLINQMDGEEIGRSVISKDQLDDARN